MIYQHLTPLLFVLSLFTCSHSLLQHRTGGTSKKSRNRGYTSLSFAPARSITTSNLSIRSPSPPSTIMSTNFLHQAAMTKETIHWIVRPTTQEDKEAIDALLKICYETLLPKDYDADLLEKSLPLITRARPELLTSGTWYLVEHPVDGTVVGCGGWGQSPTDKTQKSAPHLRHFATHPQFVRQGIGKLIWNRIRDDVISKLGPNTDLEVYSTSTAQPFYASLGFEAVETVHLPIHPNFTFPSILMRRTGQSIESVS